jgi:hypothetical protein
MAKPSRRYAQDHAIYNLHTGPADSYVPQGSARPRGPGAGRPLQDRITGG